MLARRVGFRNGLGGLLQYVIACSLLCWVRRKLRRYGGRKCAVLMKLQILCKIRDIPYGCDVDYSGSFNLPFTLKVCVSTGKPVCG